MAFNKAKLFPSERVRKIDFYMNAEAVFSQILWRDVVSRCRKIYQRVLKIFDSNPKLKIPYIYVPLHFTPEISDLYFGTGYDHHEGFITLLASSAPQNYILYVKERTSMIGR